MTFAPSDCHLIVQDVRAGGILSGVLSVNPAAVAAAAISVLTAAMSGLPLPSEAAFAGAEPPADGASLPRS
ncbi:hypothetical protein [Streptomyces virginiae]|uniref:hypothetical protein n=1 Tax=Streptomyces virginiae TaxID=1961 RepID=UPI00364A333D